MRRDEKQITIAGVEYRRDFLRFLLNINGTIVIATIKRGQVKLARRARTP